MTHEVTDDSQDAQTHSPIKTFSQGVEVDPMPTVLPEAVRGQVRRVTEIGEAILHRPCAPITEFDTPELAALIDDLFTTMLVAEGVGLAANQIDVDAQVFVYDLTDDDDVRHVGHVINPRVEVLSTDLSEEMSEGCLSVPGPAADLFRPYEVRLHGKDQYGKDLQMQATGYLARAFQHETGHLQGQLYVDLLAKRVRKKVLAEMNDVRENVIARRTAIAEHLDKEAPQYPAEPPSSAQN